MTNMMSWEIPPLPADFYLPPLPVIRNEALLKVAMTHASSHGKPKGGVLTESEILDYEKLEHIGDTLLGTTITLLLNIRHPNLRTGTATWLKAQLVSNRTHAQISQRYDLIGKLRVSPESRAVLRQSEGIQADVLESYVAAVYYDALPPSAISTPPPTPSEASGETSSARSLGPWPRETDDSAGWAAVRAWLGPLYRPLIDFAFDELSKQYNASRNVPSSGAAGTDPYEAGLTDDQLDILTEGALAALNEYCIGRIRTGAPGYETRDIGDIHRHLFTVICSAEGRDGQVHVAEATRLSIKQAKRIAAWKVAQMVGVPGILTVHA